MKSISIKLVIIFTSTLLLMVLKTSATEGVRKTEIRSARDADFLRFTGWTEDVKTAVDKGLVYLKKNQNEDGSWTGRVGAKVMNTVHGEDGPHVASTALALMAFLSAGNRADIGPYGDNIRHGLEFLVKHVTDTGYIVEYENEEHTSRMYGHCFATMCLAEAYGQSGDLDLSKPLRMAVGLIERAQHKDGGWRYTPGHLNDHSDTSVTVSALMALRAARNCGIAISKKDTVDPAIAYVKKCYNARDGSSFSYQTEEASDQRTTFALTSAGVTALLSAGMYDSYMVRSAMRYLNQSFPSRKRLDDQPFYFYAHYYGIQAYYHNALNDDKSTDLWKDYFLKLRNELLAAQQEDGSWKDQVGPNFATAMACTLLQVPGGYLPIFER